MEYEFIERQPHQRGGNWFGHEIRLYVPMDRQMELFEYLGDSYGKQGRRWRFKPSNSFNLFTQQDSVIRFSEKSDAIRFKLSWEEDDEPDTLQELFRKMSLNSTYGRSIQTFSPMLYPTIYPKAYPIWITQAKGRGLNPNPCSELFDYELGFKWHLFENCDTWSTYSFLLDEDIKREEADEQS